MSPLPATAVAVITLAFAPPAPTAPEGRELSRLLNEFLAGASRNDAAAHDRFWADELVYTASSGRRMGKADILRDVRSAPPARPGDPTTTYTAEDVRIQQYGAAAIVAFRLVGTTERDGRRAVARYLNTGTFLKRDGQWRVVAWQATRMPPADEAARKEVADAEAALHRALLASDAKELAARLDEGFVWTNAHGEQVAAKKLIEDAGAGRLKYSRPETGGAAVSLHGDTAVVRGAGDTLVFLYRGGEWKAVAMQSSR